MTQSFKLLAIVGMTGSGKSTAAKFFKDKGLPILRFGDQTDIGLKQLGLEINEKNERWYRENIRQELGMGAMAIKIEPRINETAKTFTFIVLDGLYSWQEYVYLNQKFPQLKILCIYASPEVRHKRLTTRKERPLTETEVHSRDIAEIEKLDKGGPIAITDYLIHNEGSLEDFLGELEKLYKNL